MRDTLENLYFGNITPNDQTVKSGTALKKAMEQSGGVRGETHRPAGGQRKSAAAPAHQRENEIGSTMALENFILGFPAGSAHDPEALDEDDGSLLDPNKEG